MRAFMCVVFANVLRSTTLVLVNFIFHFFRDFLCLFRNQKQKQHKNVKELKQTQNDDSGRGLEKTFVEC